MAKVEKRRQVAALQGVEGDVRFEFDVTLQKSASRQLKSLVKSEEREGLIKPKRLREDLIEDVRVSARLKVSEAELPD